MNFTHDFYEFNKEENVRINELRSILGLLVSDFQQILH